MFDHYDTYVCSVQLQSLLVGIFVLLKSSFQCDDITMILYLYVR
jgi:hypothetical protein